MCDDQREKKVCLRGEVSLRSSHHARADGSEYAPYLAFQPTELHYNEEKACGPHLSWETSG